MKILYLLAKREHLEDIGVNDALIEVPLSLFGTLAQSIHLLLVFLDARDAAHTLLLSLFLELDDHGLILLVLSVAVPHDGLDCDDEVAQFLTQMIDNHEDLNRREVGVVLALSHALDAIHPFLASLIGTLLFHAYEQNLLTGLAALAQGDPCIVEELLLVRSIGLLVRQGLWKLEDVPFSHVLLLLHLLTTLHLLSIL